MKRDRDNLHRIIHEMDFGDIEDDLMRFAKPSIRVVTERVENENLLSIGQSKIGGRPDLPRGVEWVTVPSHKDIVSLPFIAQIDMHHVKPFDEENVLPENGLLYFFGDPWRPAKHSDHGKVIFFNSDKTLLERRDFPEDIPPTPPREWGERYDPCRLRFIPEVNLPYPSSDYSEHIYDRERTHDIVDLYYAASYLAKPFDPVNRLLGDSFDIPYDVQLECQLIEDIGYPYWPPEEARKAAQARKHAWRQLFQLASDENAGMMWSDVGTISFYIKHDDLMNRNFEKICLAFISG